MERRDDQSGEPLLKDAEARSCRNIEVAGREPRPELPEKVAVRVARGDCHRLEVCPSCLLHQSIADGNLSAVSVGDTAATAPLSGHRRLGSIGRRLEEVLQARVRGRGSRDDTPIGELRVAAAPAIIDGEARAQRPDRNAGVARLHRCYGIPPLERGQRPDLHSHHPRYERAGIRGGDSRTP
ncbi:unnamed protein product [Victoria cruziana]